MIPIGLDLSLTSTGFSVGPNRLAFSSKLRGMPRLADLRNLIQAEVQRVASMDAPLILVEGYSFGSRNSQAHAAGELGGIVRMMLWENQYAYVDVPPTCLKKFATGKGNAAKGDVMSSISARTGIVWSGKGSDDICDAFVLEQIGLTKLNQSQYDWPKVNLEALDKLDWTSVGL
jgi:crossover junction endodeoxyribonuclease RuvC